MAKRKYTAEEIVTVLRKVEVSMATAKTTPQACRESGGHRADQRIGRGQKLVLRTIGLLAP